jgi:hypothetical protein
MEKFIYFVLIFVIEKWYYWYRFQNLRASTEYNILPINVGPITINIEAPETQSVSTNNNNEVQENK